MYHAEKTDVVTLGEPDALKGASPVRRGSVEKGLYSVVQVQLRIVPRWRFTLPKLLKNREHCRQKITKKRFKGLDKPPHYSSPTGKATFYSGKRVRHRANHYARLHKRLQKKGTRGAKRRLRRIGLRERQLKAQANHQIATQIINEHPQALIGLEHLTDIREHTRRRKCKCKKNGKGYEPVSAKARKSNRVYSQWSFAELHALLSYKAVLSGSLAIKVDADYTSKACPRCGHTADENRPGKGLLFVCQQCYYTLHADLVGARNVVMRTLVLRQDWSATGLLSMAPDASDREAKAVCLKRYAELRYVAI